MNTIGLARWLADNVSAIAADEAAGQCFDEIDRLVSEIERVINRPVPPRFCGPCPTLVDDRNTCGTRLSAPRQDIEVQCPSCKSTHNIERLIERLLNDCGQMNFAVSELLWILRELDEPVSDKTLYRWCKTKIPVRGYLGPGNVIISHQRNQADRALYRLDDVREFVRATRSKVAA